MSFEYREHRRILLIDENTRKLNLRATVLRNHEIEVHTCGAISEAAPLWKTIPYDFVLMALAADTMQAEAVAEQIRRCKPRQRIGLLVGPPAFIREVARQPLPRVRVEHSRPAPSALPSGKTAAEPQWQWSVAKVITDWYSDQARKSAQSLSLGQNFPTQQRAGTGT